MCRRWLNRGLALLVAGYFSSAVSGTPAGLAQDAKSLDAQLMQTCATETLQGLHAVLVILNGETLAEVYCGGWDYRLGHGLGFVHHGPETLHDIRSITKSITSLLYGIALDEGKVPPPAARLLAQFPQYGDLAGDPKRDSITIADALTMRMGTDWNETLPYSNPQNSEFAMGLAPDRYRFALDRPMVAKPGTAWSYNGGATALIGKLIEQGTGDSLEVYATEKLFQPLGITQWEWSRGMENVPLAASGLRLTARDLAKIGQLLLDHGVYKGRQVVPRSWLGRSFTPRVQLASLRYGYFWWLADAKAPRAWIAGRDNAQLTRGDWPGWVAGLGNGGQRLSIQPDIDRVVVVYAGNYNEPDNWLMPVQIIEDYITPELRKRQSK